MRKVDKKHKPKEDEEGGANKRNIIAPEHKKLIWDEEANGQERNPRQNLWTPPAVLNLGALAPTIINTDERHTEDRVKEGKSEANAMNL